MAYITEDMRLIDGVPGQQLFLYRTEDDITAVSGSGYFDQAAEEYNMDTGDTIIATTGVAKAAAVDLLVATVSGGSVTVINGS